jgi:23S rRNA (guanine2445-N2)-methyltransferase / 23S rRNA (guanine2069-N7)-methyltransferase
VAVDPPYGKRLEAGSDLAKLYEGLGRTVRRCFPGFTLALLTGSEELARSTGLRAYRTNTLYNGRIRCTLACFRLDEGNRFVSPAERRASKNASGRSMLSNRLAKNLAHLGRWAKRGGVSCYRLYDRDMPEYAFSADYFEGTWLHVQEYAPPPEIDPKKARDRLLDAVEILSKTTGVDPARIFVKTKRRQRGPDQYERFSSKGEFFVVRESGLAFFANFTDYLDAGIFLDHRITRSIVRELATGTPFLNLFGYTGTATVYAASGGASRSVTVDTSAVYLDWAARNFSLNRVDPAKHRLARADALAFLGKDEASYGLVFCDAPTFSNAKKQGRTFSVQDDHVRLIRLAAARLAPGGALLFSTNFGKFKLDEDSLGDYEVKDYTARTIPEDFRRKGKVHRCYLIRPKGG